MNKRARRLANVTLITAIPVAYLLLRLAHLARSPDDPMTPVIAYFHRNGIDLEKDKELSHWWNVTRPSGGDFRVSVAIRTFAPSETEEKMREELLKVNLALYLNARAHIAMSYPNPTGTHPDSHIHDPIDEETSKRMLELFKRYMAP
jgi:hypothetical protein